MNDTLHITLTVNGERRELDAVAHQTLLDVVRDDLHLTGTKECCVVGECGACTVMVEGRPVNSCLILAVDVDGSEILTVEGLTDPDGRLSALQEAFLTTGATQCGFCIPGQLVSAHALLKSCSQPTVEQIHEALAGNLCRCAGYEQMVEAVLMAAREGDR
jgi:aerobic carbon-monoxide dehydrogenase small subunit